ncbi:MAG: PilZ domain-containing protein [Sphingomonadales bacterium]|nr:PilZ domain-containing protein [Sphingomonadales bacterium]
MQKIDLSKAHYAGPDTRLAPRSDIYARASVTLPDGRQEVVTIVNISADGLLFRLPSQFDVNDILIFKMPIIGQVAARVIWSMAGRSGVQFESMIPVEDYLPLLRAFGCTPREQ